MSTLTIHPATIPARTTDRLVVRPAARPQADSRVGAVPPLARPRAPRPDAPHLRLTRRGRIVVTAVVVLVLTLAGVAFASSVVATSEAGAPVETTSLTVQPGDTMWDIANRVNPGADIRTTMDEIVRLNALSSAADLQSGQQIEIPAY